MSSILSFIKKRSLCLSVYSCPETGKPGSMMMKTKKIAAGSSRTISNTAESNDIVVFVFQLTEDLILEIFSHLPPTSLLRFKSVSKTWYSLISNPHFLRRNTANQFDKRWGLRINDPHISPSILLKRYQLAGDSRILILPPPPTTTPSDNDHCHQKLSPLLLQKLIDYRPEHDYDQHQLVDGDDEKELFWVIDSCNGLLLYRNRVKYLYSPPSKYNLFVCNPITHDYIQLPTFEQEEREQGFKICNHPSPNIVFNPSVSLTYKVVTWLSCTTTMNHKTINLKEEHDHYRFYVYSSVTRSWRLLISISNSTSTNQFPVSLSFSFISWRSVLCNGVLYWSPKYHSLHTNVSLCCYDVEKDVISTLNFPKMPPECRYRMLFYFGECGGRLRLIETYYTEQQVNEKIHVFPSIFDVMELDNNDVSWTVKYRVNIEDDQEGYANLIRKYRPSLFSVHILDLYKTKTKKATGEHEIDQGEEEEEELLLNICNVCIVPFNLSSNTFAKDLLNGEKKSVGVGDRCMSSVEEVLRYNTITLFPPSSA